MIANARMYSVTPEAAALWRTLLCGLGDAAGTPLTVIDHAAPAPLEELWSRPDQAAVFMCGLPYSRAAPQPVLVAAPVPSPQEFQSRPQYWSDFVVRADSAFGKISDAFGRRIAFTVAGSQSGCVAALTHFMSADARLPLFAEIIAPTLTPLGALTAVVECAAEIAPIDSYALRLLRVYRPDLTAQVRVVGKTSPTPIPPLVASQSSTDALQTAFLEVHRNAAMRSVMDGLLLQRFSLPHPADYVMLRDRYEAAIRYWRSHRLAKIIHPAFIP